MSPSGRAVYERRLHRVVEHIDRHLDRALDLEELARVAHFSPFHFHRLFSAWMGETVGDYLRRRRLEVAAQRLIAQPKLGVLQAALGVGFGSAEAFAHAFKARFGCSATAWRREFRKNDQVVRKLDQARAAQARHDGFSIHFDPEIAMNVRLVDRPAVRVACFRYTGPYGKGVSDFWQQRVAPWLGAQHLFGAPRYGISHDDPSITAPEKCRYDACVQVGADFVASHGATVTTLPAGRYASLPFKGTSRQIDAAWRSLLRDWLADSGYQLDARPCFEYYAPDSAYDPSTDAFECDIVIPVAPL